MAAILTHGINTWIVADKILIDREYERDLTTFSSCHRVVL